MARELSRDRRRQYDSRVLHVSIEPTVKERPLESARATSSWWACTSHTIAQIGDDNIFANEVALAGHITIEDHVFLSNNVGAHQFVRMGRHAMIGGKSKIVQDVLPFFITDGNPARVRGVNSCGPEARGVFRRSRTRVEGCVPETLSDPRCRFRMRCALDHVDDEHVAHLVNFIRGSKRGFTRADKRDTDYK